MGSQILFFLVIFNFLPLFALYRAVKTWVRPPSRQWKVLGLLGVAIALINFPISAFWFRSWIDLNFSYLSSSALRAMFYPALAWQTTALLFTLFLGPVYLIWAAGSGVRKLSGVRRAAAEPDPAPMAPAVSRRKFLAGGAGLLVPAIYGASGYTLYTEFDQVDVSPEIEVPIRYLPRALDGMTIVQLSDLHVGPYIGRREVEHWVSLANGLHPDLVVLTGDMIDRSLTSLPDLLEGLRGLRSDLGVIACLGNHDLSSDRYSFRGELVGGETIAQGMATLGIRTLRNELTYVGEGQDRLAVLGLDWLRRPGSRDFYRYPPTETASQLGRMASAIPPETPTLLLAHHPDTFSEVPPLEIGLTLSGHTHGGGQVVFFTWDGAPVGISSARFRYVSGLFQQDGCTLYVNRGLGYFGVPIRINCPPEISRFRLVRSHTTS
jgi:predicted MPP superfamily phosphohydrolase